MRALKAAAVLGAVGASVAVGVAPPAAATMYLGNYNVNIPDRRDFHTWIWSALTPGSGSRSSCSPSTRGSW